MRNPAISITHPEILLHISQQLNLPLRGLVAVIELLDEGGTVPFIARYRKEATGNLDEVQIRDIEEKLAYFRELVSRATMLASIAEQGKLTDDLKARIEATSTAASSKISISPTSPSAAPRPPSPATGPRTARRLPLGSSQPSQPLARASQQSFRRSRKEVWPPSKRRSKARATSSPKRISEDADLRKPCASAHVRRRRGRQPQSCRRGR
jgi:uncharacterized protein